MAWFEASPNFPYQVLHAKLQLGLFRFWGCPAMLYTLLRFENGLLVSFIRVNEFPNQTESCIRQLCSFLFKITGGLQQY